MIQNELDRIIQAKEALVEVIGEKGVEVPSGTTIDQFPEYVAQIQQGGSAPQIFSGVLNTDKNGKASVIFGFRPDVFIIHNPNGIYTDDFGDENVSDICVSFSGENSDMQHIGLTESLTGSPNLLTGVIEGYITRNDSGADVKMVYQGWNWGGTTNEVKNKDFSFTAIKYT